MEFSFTVEQVELRARVIEFARQLLRDDVVERDRHGVFARDLWERCGEFGFQGMPFPKSFGGQEYDLVSAIVAQEALGFACHDNGLSFALGAQMWSVQMPILRFGTEEQKRRYLIRLCRGEWIGAHAISEATAGSDAFALVTTARRVAGGFQLDGAKEFVSQAPLADLFLVFARSGQQSGSLGISAFLVERSAKGLEIGPVVEKMGLRTAPMAGIRFDRCVVPETSLLGLEGRGADVFRDAIEWERACILAGAVGAMDRLLQKAVRYATEREQFGRPIASFGAVANRLVDMKVRLETARLALYRAAWAKEHGVDAALASATAKIVVSDAYRRNALDAMEVWGGRGYSVQDEVERDVRDSLASAFYSGTTDIQRLVIARSMGLKVT